MNLRTGLATLTLALASLATVPALAGGFDAPAARPVAAPIAMPVGAPAHAIIARPPVPPPVAQWAQSARYAARVRTQLDQIERQARFDVGRGRLRASVIPALRRERAQVESALNFALRDRTITTFEARRIDGQLSAMAQTSARFQTRFAHR